MTPSFPHIGHSYRVHLVDLLDVLLDVVGGPLDYFRIMINLNDETILEVSGVSFWSPSALLNQ